MYKRFTIYDSDINLNDWKDFIKETEGNMGVKLSISEAYELVEEMVSSYFEDEIANLNKDLGYPILVVADFGFWNGRRTGYKVIESGNLSDILKHCSGDNCKWYCDGYNIRCEESHHDGTNYYTYRKIVNGYENDGIFNLLNKLYYNRPISKATLNYYTKSIAKDVAEIYGFQEANMKAQLVLDRNDIQSQLKYELICECFSSSYSNTGKFGRKFGEIFLENEKESVQKIAALCKKWALKSGIPDSYICDIKTFNLWKKLEMFCVMNWR